MIIPRNYVLIQCEPLQDKVMIAGKELLIDTSYEAQDYVTTCGIVTHLPEKLYFNPNNVNESMEWDTDMELQVGDKVYMDYHSVMMAFGHKVDKMQDKPDPRWIEIDGKDHVFIHYQDIFCYERGGELKTVNGYSIVEMVEKPQSTIELVSKTYEDHVKVVITGTPNRRYLNPEYSDGLVNVGDTVILKKAKSKYQGVVSIFLRPVVINGVKRFLTQGRWLYACYEAE